MSNARFFSRRYRVFYQLLRRFPWNISDRFSTNPASITDLRRWHLYACVLPFDLLSFARLSRSRPLVFPQALTGMTDYTSVSLSDRSLLQLSWAVSCTPSLNHHHRKNYRRRNTLRPNYYRRAARILIKMYCVVKIVWMRWSQLFFIMYSDFKPSVN